MIQHAIVPLIHVRSVGTLVALLLLLLGCGEEGLIDPHGDVDISPTSSEGLRAVDFPTNNGSAWTYVNVGTGEEFTVRIEDTRDVEGFTHRQMTIGVISIPQEPERLTRGNVDHLSENRLYFGFGIRVAVPLFATYFLKTPQSYIESAFDVTTQSEDVIHVKHALPRLIWDFPLEVGKEWTVFEMRKAWITSERGEFPVSGVVRRVVDANVAIRVQDIDYNALVVEEEIVGLSEVRAFKLSGDPPQLAPTNYEEPARYWVVPHVGVVKYEYTFLAATRVNFESGPATINILRSAAYELKAVELPRSNSR